MAPRKPSNVQIAEINARVKVSRHAVIAQTTRDIVKAAIRLGIAFFICFFGYKAIDSLAGKQTESNIAFNIIADIKYVVSIGFGVGGVAYGESQRRLKKKNIREMSKTIRDYELRLNPNKKSSNLTETGDTREEDK